MLRKWGSRQCGGGVRIQVELRFLSRAVIQVRESLLASAGTRAPRIVVWEGLGTELLLRQ